MAQTTTLLLFTLALTACAGAAGGKDKWDKLYGSSNRDYDANYGLPKGYQGCLDDVPYMPGC